MEVLRLSFPATVRFLPENLLTSFARPGKVLEARVETIEGRLLTLWVGEERLEALLAPRVTLKHLRPGQTIHLKVLRSGPPVVLSLVPPEGDKTTQRLKSKVQTLVRFLTQLKVSSRLPSSDEPRLEHLLLRTLETLLAEAPKGKENQQHQKPLEHRQLVNLLPRLWESGVFFLPLSFFDRVSWGFWEEVKNNAGQTGRLFRLQLFLSRLGVIEVFFYLRPAGLSLNVLAARPEVVRLLKKALPSLQEALKSCYPQVWIEVAPLESPPGSLLVMEG